MTPEERKALTELLNFCFEPGEISGYSNIETAITMLGIFMDQYRPTIDIPVSECCKGKIGFIKGSLKEGYYQCCSCGKEVTGPVLKSYQSFMQTIPDKWLTIQALQLAELFPEEKEVAYRIARETMKHLIRKGFDIIKNSHEIKNQETESICYKKGERTPKEVHDDFRKTLDPLSSDIDAAIRKLKNMYPDINPQFMITDKGDGMWKIGVALNLQEI